MTSKLPDNIGLLKIARGYLPFDQQDSINGAIVELRELREENNRLSVENAGLKAQVQALIDDEAIVELLC